MRATDTCFFCYLLTFMDCWGGTNLIYFPMITVHIQEHMAFALVIMSLEHQKRKKGKFKVPFVFLKSDFAKGIGEGCFLAKKKI